MKPGQPTWEDLNAYVDGELSDEQAAELAAALGRDPELAEQVAALHRLKGAAQSLVEEAPVTLPAGRPGAPRAPVWLRSGLALVASLVLVLLAAGIWLTLDPPPAQHVVWAERAWTAHDAWQPSETPVAAEQTAALRLAQQQLGPATFVPDLLSGGLTLERVAEGPRVDGLASLHLGYRGTRGCRLSLFVLPLGLDLGAQMIGLGVGAEAAGRQAVAWQSAGRSNLLLAEGMDPLRFAEIARRVYRASVEQRPFDAETRQALQRSHAQSEGCQS